MKKSPTKSSNKLIYRSLGINTLHEHFVYMREDCHICISEGFEALTRIRVSYGKSSLVTSLNVLQLNLLQHGEISMSEAAAQSLGIKNGDSISISHVEAFGSLSAVRAKIYGHKLNEEQLRDIITDIVAEKYSSVQLSAFITACAGERLDMDEITFLTKAMIASGERLQWNDKIVVDKHCIGGLPGNRTTPIIVAIMAACGFTMPKTSSRAITSPAGTADTMEVMSPVNLSVEKIQQVVKQEGGCIVWGGTAKLSPADDILIRVEKALDIDSEGQLIASVLSKKAAAGSHCVVIDMPVGETAKLRTKKDAKSLKTKMEKVSKAIGLQLKVIISDGSQPVGRGIGPALEARDVLAVLRNDPHAPRDLKERAILLAGELLELVNSEIKNGEEKAREVLESGKAYQKFMAICLAQGGFKEPSLASYKCEIKTDRSGTVIKIDNRKLAKLAKLAGAPSAKAAGIDFLTPLGTQVKKDQALFILYSESKGGLEYALEYYKSLNIPLILIK